MRWKEYLLLLSLSLVGTDSIIVTSVGKMTHTVHAGPAAPLAVVDLLAIAVTHNSATIQWTVPSIVYTPETYVVRYGTNDVNRMSDVVPSGSDISVTDLTLTVELTGLEQLTLYMYQVVSSNDVGPSPALERPSRRQVYASFFT